MSNDRSTSSRPTHPADTEDDAEASAQATLNLLASIYARCDGVAAFLSGLNDSGLSLANGDEGCSYLLVHASGRAEYLPKYFEEPGLEDVDLWAFLAEERPPQTFPAALVAD